MRARKALDKIKEGTTLEGEEGTDFAAKPAPNA